MKSASDALKIFLLNATNYARVDLYTLIFVGGGVMRLCSAPGVINALGHTFGNNNPIVIDGGVKCSRGLNVSTVDLTFYADDSHEVNGKQFLSFVEDGGLYGANLRIDRGVAANWSVMRLGGPLGTYNRFVGRFSEAKELGHTAVTVTFSTPLELLTAAFPPDVYQTECLNSLGDTKCGINLASLAAAGIVGSGSWTKTAFGSNLAVTAGTYDLGYLIFTSGANEGAQISIKSQDVSGNLTLVAPLAEIPTAGDTFTAYPGCLKSTDACKNKFNNLLRFRGFPFIPTPTTGLVS